MPVSVSFIRKLETVAPEFKEILIGLLEEVERQREETVTRKDFLEFAKRTEENFQKVWQSIKELNEAHKRAESRLSKLEETAHKLLEAHIKTDERLLRLKEAVEKLAEAQAKTEQRLSRLEETVEKLAEAQKRTEERLNELAEAQRRTEEELRKLIGEHKKTREALGGLTHTVGYILEDRAFVSLPELLKRDMGVEVSELKRDFVEISPAKYEEINIIGKGRKNGNEVWIIGECKAQLTKKHIDHFLNVVSRLEHIFPGEKIYVVVTYQTSPQVREYIKSKGLQLYFSYQLRL